MEALSEIKEEVRQLNERSQTTKTDLKVLEATSSNRHTYMVEKIEKINSDIEKINTDIEKLSEKISSDMDVLAKHVSDLRTLALQGKTSLKTLWFLGGFIASAIAMLSPISDLFK